ncbi:unnamed protein product [Clonostachys rosea f. rosea IK726]|uniref:Uncharacterized protein n=1 Tax=Clonostachys rosea f. rosea IK726 TaxID=1349383 RepID=A0ACA9UFP7_BIOOC|nr:unnamed protein product [Clonostachys rosea f. rosea IK726]
MAKERANCDAYTVCGYHQRIHHRIVGGIQSHDTSARKRTYQLSRFRNLRLAIYL